MTPKQHKHSISESAVFRFIRWVGSPASLSVHSVLFVAVIALGFFGFGWDRVFLVLTTAVSLEAIYLAIFIQMTVNQNTESLEEVEEDIDEIQVDIDELQEDVDEIQEDVQEITLETLHVELKRIASEVAALRSEGKK